MGFYVVRTLLFSSLLEIVPGMNSFDLDLERQKFQDRCLSFHNILRALHGSPPLKWDDTLAESSQAWANHLSTIQTMKHSTSQYGENLFSISNPKDIDLMCEYACKAWYQEVTDYDFNNPQFSESTGHFTQMVWKSTTKVGIGEAGRADGYFFIVAKYYSPGNMHGEFKDNVLQRRRIPTSCIPRSGDQNVLAKIKQILGQDRINEFVYNSSEPCSVANEEKTPEGTETLEEMGSPGSKQTGGTTGGQQPTAPGEVQGTVGSKGTSREPQGAPETVGKLGTASGPTAGGQQPTAPGVAQGTVGSKGTSREPQGAPETVGKLGTVSGPVSESEPLILGIPVPEPPGPQQPAQIIVSPSQANIVLVQPPLVQPAPVAVPDSSSGILSSSPSLVTATSTSRVGSWQSHPVYPSSSSASTSASSSVSSSVVHKEPGGIWRTYRTRRGVFYHNIKTPRP